MNKINEACDFNEMCTLFGDMLDLLFCMSQSFKQFFSCQCLLKPFIAEPRPATSACRPDIVRAWAIYFDFSLYIYYIYIYIYLSTNEQYRAIAKPFHTFFSILFKPTHLVRRFPENLERLVDMSHVSKLA